MSEIPLYWTGGPSQAAHAYLARCGVSPTFPTKDCLMAERPHLRYLVRWSLPVSLRWCLPLGLKIIHLGDIQGVLSKSVEPPPALALSEIDIRMGERESVRV